MTDTTELRKLCEAATPGPWRAEEDEDGWFVVDYLGAICAEAFDNFDFQELHSRNGLASSNAAFVAAANPAAVLALLDELDRLRAENARLRATLETISIPEGSADKIVLLRILERLKAVARKALAPDG